MAKRAEKDQMSSFIPRSWRKKVEGIIERRLSLGWRDLLNHFWVQTRMIFSRTILLILGAMFFLFTVATVKEQTFKEKEVFLFLIIQSNALAVILHMNLWETEREDRTFELLLMRIPNLWRLIWFKMRVSLFWMIILSLPFFIGYTWFVNIPAYRAFIYLFFCMSCALFSVSITCTVTSFVHNSLATGVISVILIWIFAALLEEARLPWSDYYNFFINPYDEDMASYVKTLVLIINRIILFLFVFIFMSWFKERLKKTERWIL
ncbi:hypothetical protein JW926_01705 [Candidatus Sumerlaeota bacterium]|nr:hypothetical protein [Candidatus Sumerlaeota bacterium]